MKKIKMVRLFLVLLTFYFSIIPARADAASLLYFTKEGCPNCTAAKEFIEAELSYNPYIIVEEVSVNTPAGQEQFRQYRQKYGFPTSVPIFIINEELDGTGGQVIVGFHEASDSGERIIQTLRGQTVSGEDSASCSADNETSCAVAETVTLPFVGEVSLSLLSLPMVTSLIGLADGFNPCAMWALLALLGFLLAQQSRRKLLVIGGAFLLSSFLFSWLILFGWYKAFAYALTITDVGLTSWWNWLTYLVYALALYVGYNLLRSGLRQPADACVVEERKVSITKKLAIVGQVRWPYAIVLAVLFAVFVNFIELLCSIGLPIIYTKYLNELAISDAAAAGYVTLYNVFYMLDDIIVFAGALLLSRVVFLSPRFSRWVKIIVGLLIIGIIILRLVRL